MINKLLILIGPPGSGKGTISNYILSNYKNYVHLSPGQIFRENIKNETELGKKVSQFLKNGELVTNDIVTKIMQQEIIKFQNSNIILDGYPRSEQQNNSFNEILNKINTFALYVIYLKIDEKTVIERLTNRQICSKCGQIYNKILSPSKVPGICNICGSQLISRTDDNAKTIKERFNVYNNETKSILDYYKNKKNFITIDASLPLKKFNSQINDLF